MTQELAGKTAFVAGGSSGINLGIAKRFAAAGAKVAIISRSPENQPWEDSRREWSIGRQTPRRRI